MDSAPDLGAMPRSAPAPRDHSDRKPRSNDRPERAAPARRGPPPAENAAWADVPDRMPPAGTAETAPKPAAPRAASSKPASSKPAGFKSEGFKTHGGAAGGKPKSEGMKSHGKPAGKSAGKPYSTPMREMDPETHRGLDRAKPAKPRDDKSYGKPAGKPGGKPGAKPYGKPGAKPGAKPGDKPYGKPAAKPYSKPAGDAPAPRNLASNTSARLGPGGKPLPAGKSGKPRTGGPARGPNAVPRRKP